MHAGLQVVRHDNLYAATKEGEGTHVRADPVLELLGPRRFRIRAVRRAERCDEQFGLTDLAGVRINDAQLVARVIDEQLLAGRMGLTQRYRKGSRPTLVMFAEPAIVVAPGS